MSTELITPHEMAKHLAQKVQAKRLFLNLTQQTLAKRSGVSYGSIKKFERTGQISLESLLKVSFVLGDLLKFNDLFSIKNLEYLTLDELLNDKFRKRGSI
jgi:transcriptional regulator with XRE-family HTH domain